MTPHEPAGGQTIQPCPRPRGQHLLPGAPLGGLQSQPADVRLFQRLSHPLANQSIRSMMLSLFCHCPHRYSLPICVLISSFCCVSSCKPSSASCPGSLHHWCGWQAVCCRGTHVSASVPSAIQSLILNPLFPFLDLQFSLEALPLPLLVD